MAEHLPAMLRPKGVDGHIRVDAQPILCKTLRPIFERLKEEPLLFYCEFTWFPGTTREEVAQRLIEQHDAGANNPDRIKGWYNLAGGGAGFLIVTYDEITQLTAFLQPYMDLMSFDVRAINQLDYDERVNELRAIAGQNRS